MIIAVSVIKTNELDSMAYKSLFGHQVGKFDDNQRVTYLREHTIVLWVKLSSSM